MTPRVFDVDGAERDMAWLRGKYGRLEVLTSGMTPNYDLVQIDETRGPALMKCRVLDENGVPAYVLAVLTWPSLTSPSGDLRSLTGGDPAKKQWSARGAAQFTDAQTGYTGWGLGGDSWIKDFAAGGPYHVWLFDKNCASDCLSWIGWLGGTDHEGPCSLTFKKRTGVVPPDDGDETGDLAEVLARLDAIDDKIVRLASHLGLEIS